MINCCNISLHMKCSPPIRDPAAKAISGRMMACKNSSLNIRVTPPTRAMQLMSSPKIIIHINVVIFCLFL